MQLSPEPSATFTVEDLVFQPVFSVNAVVLSATRETGLSRCASNIHLAIAMGGTQSTKASYTLLMPIAQHNNARCAALKYIYKSR